MIRSARTAFWYTLALGLSLALAAPAGDLAALTGRLRDQLESPAFRVETCRETLLGAYRTLFAYAPETQSAPADPQGLATSAIQHLFDARLAVQNRLREWHRADRDTRACVDAARNFFWIARVTEDWIGERYLHPAPYDESKPATLFEGASPAMLVNPRFGTRIAIDDLRSGDVLASRAGAFSSAAIAQITDRRGSFSHNSLVHRETDGLYTAEAHIEIGTDLQPFSKHIAERNVREVLYRQPDAELGQRASDAMAARIRSRSENIPYNFTLDMGRRHEQFCSQLVANAYEEASEGRMSFPLFASTFTRPTRYLLGLLKATARESLMPSDFEVDPRFELVAEWRDFSRVRRLRLTDAILIKLIQWSEYQDYIFDPKLKISSKALLAWSLRRSNWLSAKLGLTEKFPRNMSVGILKTIFLLDRTGEFLWSALDAAERSYAARAGVPMTMKQALDWLEAYRLQDLRDGRRGKLRRYFRKRHHWFGR